MNKIYPSSFFPSFAKALTFIKDVFSTLDLVQKKQADIFLVFDLYTFVLIHIALLMLWKESNKIIYRISASVDDYINLKPFTWYKTLLFFLYRLFSKRTKYFIFTSKKGLNDFKKSTKINKNAKFFVIYNGIDNKLAEKMSFQKLSINEEGLFDKKYFKIISVGRLVEEKDYNTTLKAFSRIIISYPFCRLYIIGSGHLLQEIKTNIDFLGLNKKVFLLGWKKNVFPYLKRSDLFIHSSNYEGFGYAILEAMTQKLPVISTNAPYGPSEILDDGKYGILTSVGDEKAIANAIENFIKNKERYNYFAKKSFQRSKFFSFYKSVKIYEKTIMEVLKNN